MDIQRVIEWYNNPPRANDIAAWAEIHKAMGTPDGSDATMRAWALQHMGQILLEEAKRNKITEAKAAQCGKSYTVYDWVSKIAQDETQGQPAQTVNQEAGSDPVKDLEAMRGDLRDALHRLSGPRLEHDRILVAELRKKWRLQ